MLIIKPFKLDEVNIVDARRAKCLLNLVLAHACHESVKLCLPPALAVALFRCLVDCLCHREVIAVQLDLTAVDANGSHAAPPS